MDRHSPLSQGTTPFPNVLLDTVRPRLKGSEWNLLCVIVRQTYGWSEGQGRRKQSDWLTHQQIKRRTGLASASICRAIETLVKGNLIVVRDNVGRELRTAAERRRAGRLHFSLGNPVELSNLQTRTPDFQKTKTTETKEDLIFPFVDFKKENEPAKVVLENEKLSEGELNEASQEVLQYYKQTFRDHLGQRKVPNISLADIDELEIVIQKKGINETKHLMDRFFASDYYFVARQHYSLSAFLHSTHFFH
jgi:hypothetical protein